jgi:hypothetical protein
MSLKDRESMALEVEKAARAQLSESAQALFYRTKNSIVALKEKLLSYSAKVSAGERTAFHNCMLDEIKSLVALLPHLNVENDPFLAGIAERLEKGLAAEDLEGLKGSAPARAQAVREADELISAFG